MAMSSADDCCSRSSDSIRQGVCRHLSAVHGVDLLFSFFFQAEDGIRDGTVTGVQTCALPIYPNQPPTATSPGGVLTFEFISGSGQTPGAILPDGNFAVPFNLPGSDPITGLPTAGDTAQQVATTMVTAINLAGGSVGIGATQLTTNGQLTSQVSVTGASSVNLTAPEFITAQP